MAKILKQHTSVGNKVAIQRKFRRLANDRLNWWYLVRSDESVLEVLDSEWEQVKSATESAQWKLEHCQRPKRQNPAAEVEEQSSTQPSVQAAIDDAEETSETNAPNGDSQTDESEAP